MKIKHLFLLAGILVATGTAQAQVLKNGDFSKGRSYWEAGGKVVFLNVEGEPVASAKEGEPILEVKLSKTQLTEVRQRFQLQHKDRGFKVAAIVKTSKDFQRNDKAPKWSRDVSWGPGGWYRWSSLVYPCVDFCLRVDADTHYYLPRALKPGAGWQTLKGSFKDMPANGSKIFTMVFPAGEGTVWVKSVTTGAL